MKTVRSILAVALLAGAQTFAQKPAAPEAKPPVAAAPSVEPKNVSPAEAEKLIKENAKVLILDVRTPEEFEGGHIEGAVNISVLDEDFAKRVADLDQSRPLLVHCASGKRSARALPVLREQKLPALYHMDGGFKAWIDAGKPTVKSVVLAPPPKQPAK